MSDDIHLDTYCSFVKPDESGFVDGMGSASALWQTANCVKYALLSSKISQKAVLTVLGGIC
jgi:hypothetical protein